MFSDLFIKISLISISVLSATVSFILAILAQKDKRKKYLGLKPKDLKNYSAYLSFVTALILIFLQTKKEIRSSTLQINRNRYSDSVENLHFDTTLRTINQTLLLQKSAIDSADTIISRQTSELKNQKVTLEKISTLLTGQDKTINQLRKILTETDDLTKSSIYLGWDLQDSYTVQSFFEIDSFANCTKKINSGIFEAKDSCLYHFPNIVNSISVFLSTENKFLIEKKFLSDTLEADISDNEYEAQISHVFFHKFKPEISVGATTLEKKSNFTCYSFSNNIAGFYYYNVTIFSKENNPVPFSELHKMNGIIVINSQFKNFSPYLLSLHNGKNNKGIFFNLEKKIVQRECRPVLRPKYHQTAYLVTIKEEERMDQ